jgi:hypothetical protein
MARTPATKGETSPPPPAPSGGPPVGREVPVPPHFNKVFFTTAGLTVLCLVISGALAVAGPETAAAKEVISGCLTMAKIGFGAIVGLIGGRAL